MGTSGVWLVHSENFKTNAIPGVLRERRQNKWFKLRFHKRGMRKRYALRVSDNKWIACTHRSVIPYVRVRVRFVNGLRLQQNESLHVEIGASCEYRFVVLLGILYGFK